MFLGEYRHQIDAKNRLRVPAKLKSELGDKFVVTKGSNGCLFVFNSKTMESLKAFAKIDKNVVTVGAGTRIEIWSEEAWNEYNSCDNFDEVLEGLGKFGV